MEKKMRKYIFLLVAILFISLAKADYFFNPDVIKVSVKEDEISDIPINPGVIKTSVKEGETLIMPINVFNTGEKEKLEISYFSKKDFISTDKKELILDKNEAGTFKVSLNSSNHPLGVYVGKINISSKERSYEIPLIFEIESKKALFDASIRVLPAFSEISPGEEFRADVSIYNLRAEKNDVVLEFYVEDLDNNVIISEIQNLNVNSQVQFTKSFSIPKDLEPGDYAFYVYAKQNNSIGVSSMLFNVHQTSKAAAYENYYKIMAVIIILALTMAFILFNHYWSKRFMFNIKKLSKKLIGIKKIKFGDIRKKIRELEYRRDLLKKAYENGYIKRKSYEEGLKKISMVIKGLKKNL